MSVIANYFLKVCGATASQMLILLGPGLVLAFILYFLSEMIRRQSQSLFNWGFWVYFTAIGTVIHELGHALFALIFGHTITEISLFHPDPATGTLGHMSHAYNERNIYHQIGNFFIGIGPIVLGTLVMYFSSRLLMGAELLDGVNGLSFDSSTLTSFTGLVQLLKDILGSAKHILVTLVQTGNFTRWQFYVFLYLIFAVGSHVKLSPEDLRGAWDGFLILLGLVFLFNLCTLWIGNFFTQYTLLLGQSYSFFYGMMLFTVILNVLFIAILSVFMLVKKVMRG